MQDGTAGTNARKQELFTRMCCVHFHRLQRDGKYLLTHFNSHFVKTNVYFLMIPWTKGQRTSTHTYFSRFLSEFCNFLFFFNKFFSNTKSFRSAAPTSTPQTQDATVLHKKMKVQTPLHRGSLSFNNFSSNKLNMKKNQTKTC